MAANSRPRATKQRRFVFEAIKKAHRHPTADWVFDQVRIDMPKISLGTVYRNLNVLKNEGQLREILGTDRRARYEARMDPHGHFICLVCSEVRDVEDVPAIEWEPLRDLVGCEVMEQRVEFRGLCPACRRKEQQA
ncbi:MAG: transcriptional repressor [bacterium]|nr:transcriptional repressor [bacterium]